MTHSGTKLYSWCKVGTVSNKKLTIWLFFSYYFECNQGLNRMLFGVSAVCYKMYLWKAFTGPGFVFKVMFNPATPYALGLVYSHYWESDTSY